MSRNDWDQLPDKGPKIEEPRHRHQKKGGGKKPFILQCKYIGPKKHMAWLEKIYADKRDWHTYQRYKTEKAREEALRHLTHRAANSHTVYSWYEYRIPPDE